MNLPVPSQNQGPAQIQPQPLGPGAVPFGFAPAAPLVSAEQKLELLEYWRSILKRKWAILALAAVVSVLASVVAFSLTPVYRATAMLLIEPGKVNIVSIAEVYTTDQQQNLQTQAEILRSRGVAERTARDLKLWEIPAFDPRRAKPDWRTRLKSMLGTSSAAKTDWTQEELEKAVIGALNGRLIVEPVRNSNLVRVSFESEDPVLAATVINAAITGYIDNDRESRLKVSQQVSSYLQDRLGSLRENLLKSEQALQSFREENGIVSLGGTAQALTGKQFGDSADRLLGARARRLELESAYEQARASKPADYAAIPAIARNPTVTETLKQIDTAQRSLSLMQETLSAGHYKVQQAQGELAQLQKLLVQQSTAAVAALRSEYEAARAIEGSFEKTLGAAKGGVQAVNRDEFRLGVLERDVASNRQLYELFLSRAKETKVAGDVQDVARLIDPAVPSYGPVRPDKVGIVLRAALVALVLGALASLLLDRLDNTIKGGDDAELRLHLPVLTALPMVDNTSRGHMSRIFLDDTHSHYAEGIRTARTGVLLSNLDVPHKILLVTSTLPGEGKTTVALNLALAHAQTKRTLLIDADMRRSQAGKALGIPPGAKGLTNLVAGNATASECVVTIKDTKLQVMPVGDLPPNPLELLLSQRFKEVLEHLSDHFEMIIIDSPPVELVSEALVLAPMCTSVAFVAKAMSTPAPLMRKSIMRIQRAGGNILGVIVNQLDFKHAQRYYGEHGAGGYSYGGYGYGTYGSKKRVKKDSRGGDSKAKPLPHDATG